MLLRSDDQELFKQPRAFKLLILDEVHTYSGTVGTEVAMLLRRLKARLSERAGTKLPEPIFVGTSATVGTGPQATKEMINFSTNLFGTPFQDGQILFGKTSQVEGSPDPVRKEHLHGLALGLSHFVRRRPRLLRLVAGRLKVDEEPGWDSHVANDLEELAVILDACWQGMEGEVRDFDLLSEDPERRSRELIGKVVHRSAATRLLIDLVQRSDGACLDLEELSARYFAPPDTDSEYAQAAKPAPAYY